MILDYQDFVEMACLEEDAVYSSQPSRIDVLHNAVRFIDSKEQPKNPLAGTEEEFRRAVYCWQAFQNSRRTTFGKWYHLARCPHCDAILDCSTHEPHLPGGVMRFITTRICRNCGWWDAEEELKVRQEEQSTHYEAPSIHRRAILRQFDVAGCDVPIGSLREYLVRHPHSLTHISPRALERLVADVFRETMHCEAIHVGGPNDGGIDIVLIDGDRRYVVQTKRRMGGAAEGVAGIREFVGAMVLAGELRGLYVSTAPRFSPSAIAAAGLAAERGLVEYIDLVDPKRLIDVCKLAVTSSGELWQKAKSTANLLSQHASSGFDLFMALYLGDLEWRRVRE
jgi:hypothetical protein